MPKSQFSLRMISGLANLFTLVGLPVDSVLASLSRLFRHASLIFLESLAPPSHTRNTSNPSPSGRPNRHGQSGRPRETRHSSNSTHPIAPLKYSQNTQTSNSPRMTRGISTTRLNGRTRISRRCRVTVPPVVGSLRRLGSMTGIRMQTMTAIMVRTTRLPRLINTPGGNRLPRMIGANHPDKA